MKVACRVLIRLFLGVFITGNIACISKEAKDLNDLIGNGDTFDIRGIRLQSIFFAVFNNKIHHFYKHGVKIVGPML